MHQKLENAMRTTVTLDTALVDRALELLGPMDRSTLLELALKSLIARESAKRLARIGGSMPGLKAPPRRRIKPLGLSREAGDQ